MRVYVAGKTQALGEVRKVQTLVRHTGHTVTYDWTEVILRHGGDSNEVDIPAADRRQYALNDMGGVFAADLVIACGHPDLCGTLWECGMAVMSNHPLWLFAWHHCSRHSVFEDLPHVTMVEGFQELGERLWEIAKQENGMDAPLPMEEIIKGDELEQVRNGEGLKGDY